MWAKVNNVLLGWVVTNTVRKIILFGWTRAADCRLIKCYCLLLSELFWLDTWFRWVKNTGTTYKLRCQGIWSIALGWQVQNQTSIDWKGPLGIALVQVLCSWWHRPVRHPDLFGLVAGDHTWYCQVAPDAFIQPSELNSRFSFIVVGV